MTVRDIAGRVRHRLVNEGGPPTPARLAELLREEGAFLAPGEALDVLRRLQDEVLGAGPLAPLLRDPTVTDVLVTAPDEVWVDRGSGVERVPLRFDDDAAVVGLVRRLLAPTGRRIDPAAPWVDARLPDGTRLHAVLAPVATRGTCVSLRTLRRQRMSLADLIRLGTLDESLASWLAAMMQARLALVVSGGTGTGKTTLLSCLLRLAGPAERIVLVEDAAELRPERSHVVALEARPANVDGAGEITLRDLVRQAMRMRPDRLVVGEVRGVEVVDMLAALNTGHDGGLTTVHANAAAGVPARLEALAGLPREALHAQLAAGLDACVHLVRDPAGVRRVHEVAAFVRQPGGLVAAGTALDCGSGTTRRGPAYGVLAGLLAARGVPAPARPSAP